MSNSKKLKKITFIGLILILLGSIVPGICIVKNIQFDQNCEGYLKQAADANTVELAYDRISRALNYIEDNVSKQSSDIYSYVIYQSCFFRAPCCKTRSGHVNDESLTFENSDYTNRVSAGTLSRLLQYKGTEPSLLEPVSYRCRIFLPSIASVPHCTVLRQGRRCSFS